MTFTHFFIKHPVASIILNVMIVIIGFFCLDQVSLREYPLVHMPQLSIHTHYANASPELVESSITNPLEDALASIPNLDNMVSKSRQNSSEIVLKFKVGTSMENSLLAVRESLGQARARLPKEASEPHIHRGIQNDGLPFMAIAIASESLNFGELTHYASLYIKNAFRSIKGVSAADIWGQSYTMSISLDAKKMYMYGINADEVYVALQKNNVSWPIGKYRDEIPSILDLKLSAPEDFDNLPIKEINGKLIYLNAIAKTNLITNDKQYRIRINGKPALILAISHANDANPLEVSTLVNKELAHLKTSLPEDFQVETILDQSTFIKYSLKNIKSSLFEAFILVLIIVFLFLRNFSATIIPLITIPISLIGSMILIKLFGFSINTITLLAMVLAIGLVVDDAIIVLENITRHIEEGLTPLNAALKGSREIGFAIVAMTLTLASVYAPIAFVQGMIGQLFIEFAVVLAGCVLISGIVALTLSPYMCSAILKKNNCSVWPIIEKGLDHLTRKYELLLNRVFCYPKLIVSVTILLFVGTLCLYSFIPSELSPKEDRGLMGIYLPPIHGKDASALEEHVAKIETMVKTLPDVQSYFTFMGDWGANVCLSLKDYASRDRTPAMISDFLEPEMNAFPSIDVHVWRSDSGLPGVDDAINGTQLALAVSTAGTYRDLFTTMESARKNIEDKKIFQTVSHNLRLDNPGYEVVLNKKILSTLGILPSQVAKTIEVFFSGEQSLHFEKERITYPITLKGETKPWTLNELYITNAKNKRISLGAFAELRSTSVPKELMHYNQMRTALLKTSFNSEQKLHTMMPVMWELSSEAISRDFKREWYGAAKTYLQSSMTMLFLFGMALVFIYAILAIQFDNFIDPLVIMFTVPLGCSGALFLSYLSGDSLNIYSQIGLITLIGLITKHGILIVEFSNKLRTTTSLKDAAIQAAVLRLRPILMTTCAMVLGSLPLVFAKGAGAEARHSIGFILTGGLFFGTFFTLFILPVLYYLIKSFKIALFIRKPSSCVSYKENNIELARTHF